MGPLRANGSSRAAITRRTQGNEVDHPDPEQLGAWLCSAFVLPANLKVKVAALVRAKARGSGTAQSAERAATLRAATLRTAIKRLTDAYTWGALGEADYREKLRELKNQLELVDAAPDERRMMTAIKLAQDLAAAWELARPERRKQLVAELFETVRVGGGRIVSVKPKSAVMPLVAVTVADVQTKDWRSRPGLEPPVFGDILVEGLDALMPYLIVGA